MDHSERSAPLERGRFTSKYSNGAGDVAAGREDLDSSREEDMLATAAKLGLSLLEENKQKSQLIATLQDSMAQLSIECNQ